MIEAAEVEVLPGRGIDAENRKPGKREITLVSTKSWADACRELGTTVPWYYRRANLLIDGVDLPATVGKTLKIGSVELLIHGETRPCGIMDQQHQGLKTALTPEMRAGVHAQVLVGGLLRVGDSVDVLARP
jgi:MOSC domain-containing protein YiiM